MYIDLNQRGSGRHTGCCVASLTIMAHPSLSAQPIHTMCQSATGRHQFCISFSIQTHRVYIAVLVPARHTPYGACRRIAASNASAANSTRPSWPRYGQRPRPTTQCACSQRDAGATSHVPADVHWVSCWRHRSLPPQHPPNVYRSSAARKGHVQARSAVCPEHEDDVREVYREGESRISCLTTFAQQLACKHPTRRATSHISVNRRSRW